MENAEEFVKLVCDYLKLPIEIVKSKDRHHEFCEARQVISYLLDLHTNLSLHKMALIVNYVSHASPIRDIRQVNNFLEIDKKFAAKILPLINDAKALAERLDNKEKDETHSKPPEHGDICWFWNENIYTRFPIIGTFERSYLNEDNEQRYVSREHPAFDYSHCVYAGQRILPERFRGCSTDIIPESYSGKEKVPELATC